MCKETVITDKVSIALSFFFVILWDPESQAPALLAPQISFIDNST